MRSSLLTLALVLAAAPAAADPVADARAILKEAVEVPTVVGRGQVPVLAAKIQARLLAAGFAPADVKIETIGETAILSAVYHGTGARPIAVIGHMDVVEADQKDWTRDPFKLIEENGYLFGRGVFDNKFDVSMILATLVRLKAEGFKPRRDIILYLSGDEETGGANTADVQAKQAKAAGVEFVLNGDSGGGLLDNTGKPLEYSLSAAEKTYADFAATITNPGGHSSLPTKPNAIVQLAAATERMAAHDFPAQVSEITRASLKASGLKRGGPLGAALVAFSANPADAAAIATLRANPETIGQIGTTCVPTMISGGHAPNALPQRVTVNINCRIFPGVEIEAVRQTLIAAAAEPAMTIKTTEDFHSSPPSPLRPDVVAAVDHAVAGRFPGFKVVPGMDAGASDSVFYRARGIPSYGVSGMFIRGDDVFIHGLNERIPVASIGPALAHWHSLLTELSK